MQIGNPIADYNLFHWVHVLSHYHRALEDPRFHEAFAAVQARLVEGQVVPERVNRGLAGLAFCRKGVPSRLATLRFQEIQRNIAARAP
ncbi:MAG TPA: hypothetical protein VLR88_10295 [Propionibacteriaceae bacterium]|nr:hypothetical protein [Propionibacteriaceae bacterium]